MHQEFFCLSRGGNRRACVVNFIALASASIEIIRQLRSRWTQGQFGAVKDEPMMAGHAGYSIPGAGDHHFCGLERGIVSGSETPVFREALKGCVSQIAGYEASNLAEFLHAGSVPVDLSVLQQFCPAHRAIPSAV